MFDQLRKKVNVIYITEYDRHANSYDTGKKQNTPLPNSFQPFEES